MLRALIVDDEPHAHDVLTHHCQNEPDIVIVAKCHSASEALEAIQTVAVDLMFLDIRMPLFGGLDLLRGLHNPPLTVIVSAHQDHALDGFDLDVIDYLLKPVSAERFKAALGKVRRRVAEQSVFRPEGTEDLVLKIDRTLRRFRLAEISSFEAQSNFVMVVGDQGSALATITLKSLRKLLPLDRFTQIHRSHIVNRDRIVAQLPDAVQLDDGRVIPIGKTYRGVQLLE